MPAQLSQARANLRGSLFMLLAMASFALGDTILKLVNAYLPLSQILVIRGMFAVTGFYLILHITGQKTPIGEIFRLPFLLRLLGEVIATIFFLTALFNMPLANASAIMQALPLTVSLGAAYFFGEVIGWRRILAIIVGFAGILLIVQPGLDGFTIYSVYCLIAVFGTTMRDLATRKISADVPSVFVAFVTVIVIMLLGLVLSLFEDWQPVGVPEISALALASVFLMSGFIGIVSSMRVGEVGVVTPFRYTVLIFAVVIGYLVFAEIPDKLTIAGSMIVVASGLYTLYRENLLSRKRK